MRWTAVIAAGCGVGIVTLLVLIVLSSFEMSLGAGLARLVETGWGVTTLVDLYAGLFAFAAWIGWRERSWARGLAWLVALCLLGNLTTLVYLLIASLRAKSLDELVLGTRAGATPRTSTGA